MGRAVVNGNQRASIVDPADSKHIDGLAIALYLVAIAPLFHAIMTWDRDGRLSASAFAMRHLSLPVVGLELFIVLLAMRNGFDLRNTFHKLSLPLKGSLIIWGAFALYTSFFRAPDLSSSLFVLIRYTLHGVVLAFFVDRIAKSRSFDVNKYLGLITIGAMLYLLTLTLFVYLTRNADNFAWALRIPSATNIRQIGNLLSILAIVPVTALLAREQKFKAPYFLAVMLIIAFIAWSGTRGGILGLALGATLGILSAFRFTSWRNIALLLLSIASGLLLSLPFFRPAADFGLIRMVNTVISDEHISPGRIEMWQDTLSEISINPFFGFGSGSYRENMFEKYRFDFNHPHNVVLQYIYDWGIFGGTAALVLLAWLGWKLFTLKDRGSTVQFLSVAAFCTTVAIAMIEGTLFHPLPILMAVAMISVALGTAARSEPTA